LLEAAQRRLLFDAVHLSLLSNHFFHFTNRFNRILIGLLHRSIFYGFVFIGPQTQTGQSPLRGSISCSLLCFTWMNTDL